VTRPFVSDLEGRGPVPAVRIPSGYGPRGSRGPPEDPTVERGRPRSRGVSPVCRALSRRPHCPGVPPRSKPRSPCAPSGTRLLSPGPTARERSNRSSRRVRTVRSVRTRPGTHDDTSSSAPVLRRGRPRAPTRTRRDGPARSPRSLRGRATRLLAPDRSNVSLLTSFVGDVRPPRSERGKQSTDPALRTTTSRLPAFRWSNRPRPEHTTSPDRTERDDGAVSPSAGR